MAENFSFKKSLRILPLMCVAVTPFTASSAQADDKFAPVRKAVETLLEQRHVPSVSVAVAKGGKILWEESFGFADREKRIRATPDTMYSLASISKPITGTALMTLVRAGKIDLDKPINQYLGDAKLVARVGNADDATVRRVANHSSGLPEHYQFFYTDEPWPRPSPDETIRRYGNLLTAPGEQFRYSNLGYGVLSYAISRVSGASFSDYVRKSVFDGLGMSRSSVGNDPAFASFEAVKYGDDQKPIPPYETDHDGASAVYTSAHDLVRFGMFSLKEHLRDQAQILPDSMIDAMQAPTMKENSETGYGVGWESSTISDYRVLAHTGGMPGVATELRLIPSEQLAIVVLCNAEDNRLTHIITDQITQIEIPGWKKSESPPGPPWVLPTALAGTWKGKVSTYQGDIPLVFTITRDGEVRAKLGSQLETLLNYAHVTPDGYLRGAMMGSIGIEDAVRRPYLVGVNLKIRSADILNGAVTARADMIGTSPTHGLFPPVNGQSAPTVIQNETFILSQWAELKREML